MDVFGAAEPGLNAPQIQANYSAAVRDAISRAWLTMIFVEDMTATSTSLLEELENLYPAHNLSYQKVHYFKQDRNRNNRFNHRER